MKKVISALLALMMIFSFSACKKNEEAKKGTHTRTSESKEPEEKADDFYTKITKSDSRPIAVMIDNNNAARPQTGLENAYLIYEITVEGASTRLMALFLDEDLTKVGPVRSSRHYFLDYAMENDAIYTHCGYSPQAASDIKSFGVNNINELQHNNGKNFFRDKSRKAPHNLYASLPELKKYAEDKGYSLKTSSSRVFSYNKVDTELKSEKSAVDVKIPYSSSYTVSYKYNADKKVYERYINSNPHINANTGAAMTAKNIIVYAVKNYSIDNKDRQNLEDVGSGNGFYISDGKCVQIEWSKNSRREKTVYKTEDGKTLEINPGNTFVQIIPLSANLTIE